MQATKPLIPLTPVSETPQSLAATGDMSTILIATPMTIIQLALVISVAPTAGSLVVAFDRRITAGSDTGRVNAALGSLSKGYASLTIGVVLKKDVSVTLDKGDQIVPEITTATTAGTGIPFALGYVAGEGANVYSSAATPVLITVDSD